MAVRTKSELMNLITSGLANNTTGAITAEILRNLTIDIVDSCFNEPAPPSNVPAGTIIYVAMPNAPDGYLKANGQEVSRTTYANLFNAIGTRYGVGNGVSTFNLPDLRGTFIRCWSDGSTKDQGRQFASEQKQGVCAHAHKPYPQPDFVFTAWTSNPPPPTQQPTSYQQPYGYGGTRGGTNIHSYSSSGVSYCYFLDSGTVIESAHFDSSEVRPANIALLACIKF